MIDILDFAVGIIVGILIWEFAKFQWKKRKETKK